MRKLLIATILMVGTIGSQSALADGDDHGVRDGESYGDFYQRIINEDHSWIIRSYWAMTTHSHDSRCGHARTEERMRDGNRKRKGKRRQRREERREGRGNQVPELDAATSSLAFLALGGLIALSRERRKRKPKV